MSEYTLKGIIKVISDEVTFDSGFNKREFVVTTDEKYPQDIKMECVKDKVKLLEDLRVGNPVECAFNIRGNEYNDKYYVNLTCWKLKHADIQNDDVREPVTDEIKAAAERAQAIMDDDNVPSDNEKGVDDGDNLPF